MSEQDQVQDLATNESQEQELEINLDDIENVEGESKTYTEEQFRQVVARAKKAEAQLKAAKTNQQPTQQNASQTLTNIPSNTTDDIDVKILKAQGIPQDEIDVLRKIAKVNGASVIDAREDNLFKLYKTQKEAQEKAEKARLGASKGSGSVKKEKGLNTPGLSPEEHRQMWREKNGLI